MAIESILVFGLGAFGLLLISIYANHHKGGHKGTHKKD